MTRRTSLQVLMSFAAFASISKGQSATDANGDYVCPMDPDVHSPVPGKCPRCGMQLEARVIEPVEYGLELTTNPPGPVAAQKIELCIQITQPGTRKAVQRFEVVHEKLLHLFAIRSDLDWFLHDHPVKGTDDLFRLPVTFPSIGMYELFADFYPSGGTPQWISRFLYTRDAPLTPAAASARKLRGNPQRDGDVEVNLQLDPPEPFAGRATSMFFLVSPGDGLELYLGTYAHAFWISDDLLDAEHTHPEIFGHLQFQVFFPRACSYRFWLQFQRKGIVHTVSFDIAVAG